MVSRSKATSFQAWFKLQLLYLSFFSAKDGFEQYQSIDTLTLSVGNFPIGLGRHPRILQSTTLHKLLACCKEPANCKWQQRWQALWKWSRTPASVMIRVAPVRKLNNNKWSLQPFPEDKYESFAIMVWERITIKMKKPVDKALESISELVEEAFD